MNMQCDTGVRYNSIQSGVTISGQVCWYQVIACQVSDSMSIVKCHISGASVKCHISGFRCQVPSDNMSSTGVRYQVSGVKYNMSSTGVKYQVSGIRCQI